MPNSETLLTEILAEMRKWAASDNEAIAHLEEIRMAIDNQTEYLREEDAADAKSEEDSPNADRRVWDEWSSSGAVNVNTVRRSRRAPVIVPEEVQRLLQETPHLFRTMSYTEISHHALRGTCRLCELSFRNSVHLIQMAQLPINQEI